MADFRIRNEVGVTVFALLSGLSVLLLTAWLFGARGCTDSDHPPISPMPVNQAKLKSLEADLAEVKSILAEVPASGVSQENVSAVYLSQTTRFAAEFLSPNRVVEVRHRK